MVPNQYSGLGNNLVGDEIFATYERKNLLRKKCFKENCYLSKNEINFRDFNATLSQEILEQDLGAVHSLCNAIFRPLPGKSYTRGRIK